MSCSRELVNSMTEFKQIIGRGTRVRDDYGKFWFNIIDYTGSATRNFADPAFDGEPVLATEEKIDEHGKTKSTVVIEPEGHDADQDAAETDETVIIETPSGDRRKYYFDGGAVEIAAHLVYELDPDGRQLRVVKMTDFTAERVRTMCTGPDDLRQRWRDPVQRAEIVAKLKERGIDFDSLASQAGQPEADPFDLLCHLAFNAPILTRRQRADRVKKEEQAFFEKFAPEARAVLDDLLEKYAEHGTEQFVLPDVLHIPAYIGAWHRW